jgi:hypothetical protein
MSAWLVRPWVRNTSMTRSRLRSRNQPRVPSPLPVFVVVATPKGNHGEMREFVKSADIVRVNRTGLLTNTPA